MSETPKATKKNTNHLTQSRVLALSAHVNPITESLRPLLEKVPAGDRSDVLRLVSKSLGGK